MVDVDMFLGLQAGSKIDSVLGLAVLKKKSKINSICIQVVLFLSQEAKISII